MATGSNSAGPFELPRLDYPVSALEPVISQRTLGIHHDKHHRTDVDNLNNLVRGTHYAAMTLEQVVAMSAVSNEQRSIFNNAAQAWNHGFFWHCLKPGGGGVPSVALEKKLNDDFGSVGACKKKLADTAIDHFGSGWAWLVLVDNRLSVVGTGNADTPLARGLTPLLALDVWEHAYFLDYQNRRAEYVHAVIEKLIDWDFVASNYRRAVDASRK